MNITGRPVDSAAARNIVWFKEFPKGRFANAAFQFVFARYVERKLGCTVVLGDQPKPESALPSQLFGLPGRPSGAEAAGAQASFGPLTLAQTRRAGPDPDIARIRQHFEERPGTVLCVDGYFQYDTQFFKSDPDYAWAFDEFLGGNEAGRTAFQQILKAYVSQLTAMARGGYLIGLHVRRGDYLTFGTPAGVAGSPFYTVDLAACVSQVLNFITVNHIAKPFIYVASDDLDYCIDHFARRNISIVTRKKLLQATGASELNELMVDIAALASANVVLASNSSLSMLSCLLNRNARVFLRQTPDGAFLPFDPWATSVLLGL